MSNLGLRRLARPSSSLSSLASQGCIRWLHNRREPLYPVEQGLGKFLPPDAYKMLAVDYQNGLLDRLNGEVKGTENERKSVVQTIINTSGRREDTLAFNYASLALNNSFFLDQLKPPPNPPALNHQNEISPALLSEIRSSYGGLGGLKIAFSAAASGFFTSGWIWCVTDKTGVMGIVPTYGPGTLLIRSRTYAAHHGKDSPMLGEDTSYMYNTELYDQIDKYPEYQAEDDVLHRKRRRERKAYLQEKIEKGEVAKGSEEWEEYGEENNRYDEENDAKGALKEQAARSPISKPPPPGVSPSSPASGVSGKTTPPTPPSLHPRFLHASSARMDDLLEEMPSGIYSSEPAAHHAAIPRNRGAMLNLGDTVIPLFCVPVYEHAWMSAGYGIWGKEQWLKEFWSVVNWQKISEAYEMRRMFSEKSTRK